MVLAYNITVVNTPLTVNVVQEGSAERPSELSVRSAPPARMYRLVQPVYRPYLDPIVEETLRQIREIQNEDMRESLERIKRRRDPPEPVSPEVIKTKIEASYIIHQNEALNTAFMMSMMNLMNIGKVSEHLEVEEIKEAFLKPFRDMRLEKERIREKEWRDTLDAVGELLLVSMPDTGPSDDFMQRYRAAVSKKEDPDREANVDLGILKADYRKRKDFELEILEYQNKQIIENIYKDINRMCENG
jgi:hypothetical protein